MTPETCPNCGTEVPPRAKSCPECGADEATGWNDRATEQRLGVADPEDFDAEEFQREEFGDPKPRRLPLIWLVVAVLLLGALVIFFLR